MKFEGTLRRAAWRWFWHEIPPNGDPSVITGFGWVWEAPAPGPPAPGIRTHEVSLAELKEVS